MQLAEQRLDRLQPPQLGMSTAASLTCQFDGVAQLLRGDAYAVDPLGFVERPGAADRLLQRFDTARNARVERPTPLSFYLGPCRRARGGAMRLCIGRSVEFLRAGLVELLQDVTEVATQPSLLRRGFERISACTANTVLHARERSAAAGPFRCGPTQQGESDVELADAAERARGAAQCPLQPIGQSRLEAEEWHEFPQAARRHPGLVDPADVALLHLMQQPGEGLALRS